MTREEMQASFGLSVPAPTVGQLKARFETVLTKTRGDMERAIAAVNELLDEPVTVEDFLARIGRG